MIPIEPCEIDEIEPCDCQELEVYDPETTITRLCKGDLYVIGKIWIDALKSVLVGAKFNLIPVVEAAKPPPTPERPPPMKYKDLPIYKSPHYEYKTYEAEKGRCCEHNKKLLHSYLHPHVTEFRRDMGKRIAENRKAIIDLCKSFCCYIETNKRDIKKYMRCDKNLQVRQGAVAAGLLAGFYLGSKKGSGIPRKLFFTSLGGLAAGALCFPEETDEIFRNASFIAGKSFLVLYNGLCRKNITLRERLPCPADMPPEPPKRTGKPQCPEKK